MLALYLYPLEYSFYLLGDVKGKTVVDLGCGAGENIPPLCHRGANVIGIDISSELVDLAEQRIADAGVTAELRVGSLYNTGLADRSIDAVFCIALLHHLDLELAVKEICRILSTDGIVVIQEPIRFSSTYARLRKYLPSRGDISEYEHPLTEGELAVIFNFIRPEEMRYFRLPFIPLLQRLVSSHDLRKLGWRTDSWLINHVPACQFYATTVAFRARPAEALNAN